MLEEQTISQNWSYLNPGDRVAVKEPGRLHYEATVDILTEDADIVWIIPDAGSGRRAFDRREGVTIRPSENPSLLVRA